MATRIALVGMCDKDLVDEIINEIENRNVRITIEWNFSVWEDIRSKLEACIKQNGYARFFMYEKIGSGGKGIRVAAHFDSYEDIMEKNCYKRKPCLTRFHVKGYEIFKTPLDISTFTDVQTGDRIVVSQGLGKAFAYVNDPQDVKGSDLNVFVMLASNSDSWQSPTGSIANPKKDTYYAGHGFGHEEWNFRAEHAVDGFLYGFMMGRPVKIERLGISEGEPFPVYFYAPDDDDVFLIGGYLRSKHVDKERIDEVHEFHKRNGIIDERIDELLPVIENRSTFGKTKGFRSLSIAKKRELIAEELGTEGYSADRYLECPIESSVLLPQPIIIDTYLKLLMKETYVFRKYSRPLYLRVYPVILNKHQFADEPVADVSTKEVHEILEGKSEESDEGGTIDPHDSSYVIYSIKSQTKEYLKKEYDLVNKFRSWLKDIHGIESYKESKSVDVRFSHNGITFGVEAKYSDGKMRFPIRSALGQILEYNFYPGRNPKDHWIILLNRRPNKEERKWLRKIEIGVPISLCWENKEDFTFVSNPLE